MSDDKKKYLVFRFDVTGLSEDQIDALSGEVQAQAESSPPSYNSESDTEQGGHPSVRVDELRATGDSVYVFPPAQPKTHKIAIEVDFQGDYDAIVSLVDDTLCDLKNNATDRGLTIERSFSTCERKDPYDMECGHCGCQDDLRCAACHGEGCEICGDS